MLKLLHKIKYFAVELDVWSWLTDSWIENYWQNIRNLYVQETTFISKVDAECSSLCP